MRMLWLGGGVLLGFQTGYALLNAESGEQTQLASMPKGTPPAAVELASGEVLVSLEGHSQIFSEPPAALLPWRAPSVPDPACKVAACVCWSGRSRCILEATGDRAACQRVLGGAITEHQASVWGYAVQS